MLELKNPQHEDVKYHYQKLVPWISWDDWNFVKESLFSSSQDSVASALRRIFAWQSRGNVPVVIEVTASIIEIQQKDPFFRNCSTDNALNSEEMLSMLYCMSILRLVNGIVEKTRKKTEISIAEAADAIGIPRMLIDVRHEGSHRDLPSLQLVRLASIKALSWLKSYYWEAQKKVILFQNDKTANIRHQIKSTVHELALSLKAEQTTRWSSSAKGKRSKKHARKALKNVLRLYSSYSSEVASVLLEFLLNALDSADLESPSKSSQVSEIATSSQTVLDDWKLIIIKLSNKEPELLLILLKAVVEMIDDEESTQHGRGQYLALDYKDEDHRIKQLPYLFVWLIRFFEVIKSVCLEVSGSELESSAVRFNLPKTIFIEFLRKCLLLSPFSNNQLMDSALVLAHMSGDRSLIKKLDKLSMGLTRGGIMEEDSSLVSAEDFLSWNEESIRQAAEKLDVCELRSKRCNNLKRTNGNVENRSRWVVSKSWNPCPIGMLPCALVSSGCLPVLDCNIGHKEALQSSENKQSEELNQHSSGKREAESGHELLDNYHTVKKRRENGGFELVGEDNSSLLLQDFMGQLMIGGVWKKVRAEEVLAIASGIRILV